MPTITKICKNCNQEFIIEYKLTGSGCTCITRKTFCSNECRLEWQRKRSKITVQTDGKIQQACVICNALFWVYKSHKNARKTCSKKCASKNRSNKIRKNQIEQRICKFCNTQFECLDISKQKYCSLKCASLGHRNRIQYVCVVCGKQLETKKSHFNDSCKCCSKACQNIAQSNGMIHIHVCGGKSGYRTDIPNSPYFKSAFEADYYRYCLYKNINVLYESMTLQVYINDKLKNYTPDFYDVVNNQFIELKGMKVDDTKISQQINSNSYARELLIQQGYNIQTIYMEDFYNFLVKENLYKIIPNLERRNYNATKHLITKHNKN